MRGLTITAAALCAACTTPPAGAPPPERSAPTLVAVFGHPDDESFVSPVLARYAREGVRVYLVIATDGSQGVASHAGIPAGDSLAAIRVREARCSARELGLQEPIMLGLPDAGLAALRPWPGEPLDRLAHRLEALLGELVHCRRVVVAASPGDPVELEIVPHDSSKPMALISDQFEYRSWSVRRLILTVPPDAVPYVISDSSGTGTVTLTARR